MPDAFPTAKRVVGVFPRVARVLPRLRRAVLILVLLLAAVHLTATVITGYLLRREFARLRAAGEPLSLTELAPTVPPGQTNAADVYQQAFATRRLSDEEGAKLFDKEANWDAEWLALARRVVAANRDYFRLLEEASRIPACAFPVRWDDPFRAVFPHLSEMRDAARMLRIRAEVLAADNRLDEATTSCATAFRIAEHAKLEPTLISQLVGYAIQGMALPEVERVLSRGAPSPGTCQALFDQLSAIDQANSCHRAVQGERAMGVWFFVQMRTAPPHKLDPHIFSSGEAASEGSFRGVSVIWLYRTLGRPLLNLDELTYLKRMRAPIEASQVPYPRSKELVERAEAAWRALPRYRGLITNMLLPVFTRSIVSKTTATAHIGAAQIALALKVYQVEKGHHPASLDELAAAGWQLPGDPLDGGKPYHYRREGDGFVVWSVGPDTDDDGGRGEAPDSEAVRRLPAEQRKEAKYDYDITFRCDR